MRADLSPAVEELLEGFDSSASVPLTRRELTVEVPVAVAFLAAAIALAASDGRGGDGFPVLTAVALVIAYAVVSRVKFAIGYGFTVPTQLVFVPMLFMLPPSTVPLLVAAASVLGMVPDRIAGRRHPDRALLALGDSWHAIGPALVLVAAGAGDPSWSDWPVYAGALAAQFAVDGVVSTVREWLAFGVAPRLQPKLLGWVFLVDSLLSPIGLLAAFSAVGDPLAAILAVLPLTALLAIFAGERQGRIDHALELSRAYRGTTLLLSNVLEAEDEYTGRHSRSVVSLAVAVAEEMGLDAGRQRNVEFGALLHDIGKIAVPTEIINKPGPLTDEEWVVIRTHTIEGQRMLDQVGGVLSDVGRIVRSSHERHDGGGYPDGLAGEDIPLEAAIVSAADAFNAITTDRSYRARRPPEAALDELAQNAGTQFHPEVVDVLARVVQRDLRVGNRRPPGDDRVLTRP